MSVTEAAIRRETLRQQRQRIEGPASQIAQALGLDGDDYWTWERLVARNRDGWSYDVSIPGETGSSFTRWEGVELSESELAAAYLLARRWSARLAQQQVADHLGVTVNTVARWERGALRVQQPRMVALALDRL